MIGRTVSRYRIVEQIGEGGMGVVYRAEDSRLRRTVALKFLRARALEDEGLKVRFVREAQAAAALDHENICTIYEIDEVEGRLFIAMAFVEGASLKDVLRRGPLPVQRASVLARQIAAGLVAAHERGVVHRDIKPGNIMVTTGDRVKITDFGLARVGLGTDITVTSGAVGTPAYMSPEQLRRGPVDGRTDVWSWGVTFHEMLSGRVPFEGQHPAEMIYAIVNDPPRPLPVSVPPAIVRIVERALAKVPDQRYASASELLAEMIEPEHALRTGPRPPSLERPSIAVLPFADMSASGDQEYFCDGIAEEIINDLAQVDGVRVVSRTSSFAYKGRAEDMRRIGRDLGVGTVLEGSVRKAGERLRITAQLVDVADGCHVWSAQYDRKLADVFAVQEEIASAIVGALRLRLSDRARTELARPPARDFAAYDLYLRGRERFYRTRRANVDAALELFRRATEHDAGYARAWAGISDCHAYLYMYFDPRPAHLEAALDASERALALDPDSAEAHAARGFAVSLDRRFPEAESEFRAAIRLNPSLFEAHYFYARMCVVRGEFDAAARLFEQAARVSPGDYLARSLLAMSYKKLGRSEESLATYALALRNVERHLEREPDDVRAMYLKTQALVELGRVDEGLALADRIRASADEDPYTMYGLACAYARGGRIDDALDCLVSSVHSGFAQRDWARHDPDLDSVRDYPRFVALMADRDP